MLDMFIVLKHGGQLKLLTPKQNIGQILQLRRLLHWLSLRLGMKQIQGNKNVFNGDQSQVQVVEPQAVVFVQM
jgi:hypothetical protein